MLGLICSIAIALSASQDQVAPIQSLTGLPFSSSSEGDPQDIDAILPAPWEDVSEETQFTAEDQQAFLRGALPPAALPPGDPSVLMRAVSPRAATAIAPALTAMDRLHAVYEHMRSVQASHGELDSILNRMKIAGLPETTIRELQYSQTERLREAEASFRARTHEFGSVFRESCRRLQASVEHDHRAAEDRQALYGVAFKLAESIGRQDAPTFTAQILAVCALDDAGFREQIQAEILRFVFLERVFSGLPVQDVRLDANQTVPISSYLSIIEARSKADSARLASFGFQDPRVAYQNQYLFASDFAILVTAFLESSDATEDGDGRYVDLHWLLRLIRLTSLDGPLFQVLLGPLDEEGITGLLAPHRWIANRKDLADLDAFMTVEKRLYRHDDQLRRHWSAIENLRQRVDALEKWRREVDAEIVSLWKAIGILQEQMLDMYAWRETVDERLDEIELRLDFIETEGAPARSRATPMRADRDRDQIDDRLEDMLIQAFAPVYEVGEGTSRPPCSPEWFVQHCYLRGPGDPPGVEPSDARKQRASWVGNPYLFMETYRALAVESGNWEGWRLQFASERFRDGTPDSSVGVRMSWDRAIQDGNTGMFGHVVRANRQGTKFVVQYFMLLTWNETAYSGGFGNHEGDWLCAMFWIDLPEAETVDWKELAEQRESVPDNEWNALVSDVLLNATQLRTIRDEVLAGDDKRARVTAMRLCNHGRYIDSRGDAIDWRKTGRAWSSWQPVLWMEEGSNELWPNRGERGYTGWPRALAKGGAIESMRGLAGHDSGPTDPWTKEESNGLYRDGREIEDWSETNYREPHYNPNGYRISFHFGRGQSGFVVNEHKVVRPHDGANGPSYVTRDIPNLGEIGFALSPAADIVLHYRGKWGGWWKVGGSPEGPWKDEMWIEQDPPAREAAEHRLAAQIDPRFR